MIGAGRDYLCLAELHEQGRNMDMDKGPASAWALCGRNTVVFPGLSSETALCWAGNEGQEELWQFVSPAPVDDVVTMTPPRAA